ncbi:MAG TPA: hypothetical protein VND64_25840 [Pirellulales bacterium]|nr:hypothetical protein [Pirellulales bacterium]
MLRTLCALVLVLCVTSTLAALPAMKKELAALEADDLAAARLTTAVRRIAAIVIEVHLPDGFQSADSVWTSSTEKLKAQPLTGKSFAEVLIAFLGEPGEAGELKLAASRSPGEGLIVSARVSGKKPRRGAQLASYTFSVRAGKEQLLHTQGSSVPSRGLEICRDLIRSIDKALAESDETPIEIRATIQP